MKVSDVIKNSGEAIFSHYRQGYIYYRVVVTLGEDSQAYTFPIEVSDLGTATVSSEEKPITLMRYIRKSLEDGSFVRSL